MDIASGTQAANGSLTSTFRFTSADDTIDGMTATIQEGDTLIDGSTTDNDVFNIMLTGDTMNAMTAVNIETINLNFASGADNIASLTNFSGMKTINVTGSVAGKVLQSDGVAINIADFGRVLTIEDTTFAGTTANGTAETVNVSISGATFGTTAATQSGIIVDGIAGGVVETLNITSAGSAANVFSLLSGGAVSFGTVNVLGTADATIRVAKADVSGVTIDGSKGTGSLSLSLDVDDSGATSVNGANWTGVNNIVLRDSATGSATDAASITALKSGHNIVVANSVGNLDVAVQGATFSALADKATLTLNGTSTTAGVTVGKYDLQNVKALDLVSTGLASSTATTAANTVTTLDGDFTTIKISGDTSLAITNLSIDATQTASSTSARAVTVDASSMTGNAFLSVKAVSDAKVSYTITGTAKNDTITLNNSGGTVNAGDGNDTVTGGDGNDTVNLGAGDDTYVVSFGTDTVTLGAGKDTIEFGATATRDAAAQVSSFKVGVGNATAASGDDVVLKVTINGVEFTSATEAATTAVSMATAFITEHSSAFQGLGINLGTSGTTADILLTFTAQTAGTAFSVTSVVKGTTTIAAESGTQANVVAATTDTTVTDFTAGTGGDVLNFDAFLGTSAAFLDAGSTTVEGAIGATATAAEFTSIGIAGKVVLIDTDNHADATALGSLIVETATADKLFLASGDKSVILLGDVNSASTGDYKVFYVTGGSGADGETISQVGTLSNVDLDALVATNLF